jgi:hypothetical protein
MHPESVLESTEGIGLGPTDYMDHVASLNQPIGHHPRPSGNSCLPRRRKSLANERNALAGRAGEVPEVATWRVTKIAPSFGARIQCLFRTFSYAYY